MPLQLRHQILEAVVADASPGGGANSGTAAAAGFPARGTPTPRGPT
jgi:hypothetical protein